VNLEFDLNKVESIEFGVGRDDGNGEYYVAVPVDQGVRTALLEMVQATWRAMKEDEDGPTRYQPSEKYGSTAHLYLPLNDELASAVLQLHTAENIPVDSYALDDPKAVFCYFARLTDCQKRRLTAVRRATHFKGVLKSKNRLVRMFDDTLQIIEGAVFKLDNDFDLLVDAVGVHILRPSGFEFLGKLQQAILNAVPENIKAISEDLPFVDFGGIEEYAKKHPRAARYLASIRAQAGTKIDKGKLKSYCERLRVAVREENSKLVVEAGQEMRFLEVLDRRLYEVDIMPGEPERYRAANRRKVNG